MHMENEYLLILVLDKLASRIPIFNYYSADLPQNFSVHE